MNSQEMNIFAKELLAIASRALTRRQFQILSLRYPLSGEGMTRPEVAQELEIPLARVRSLEMLALANLKRLGSASRAKSADL